MHSEHKPVYSVVIKEGETEIGVATLRHLASENYIMNIAYNGRKFIALHIDGKGIVYNAESSEKIPENQRELVRLTRTARKPLELISSNPNGTDPKFLEFIRNLEANLTNPGEFVDYRHQRDS